jgi:predicted MPP superfamily phosphohydrolase
MKEFKALLTQHGVTVLSGEYVTLERDGQSIVLAGLDDPNGLADQTTGPELRARITDELGSEVYSILLSHRDTPEDYAPWGFQLTFCGHGHGGIFRIPLLDKGLLGTDRALFPDYDGGLFELDGSSYVVSRGLGSNTVPIRAFRLFNRPHLPLVILTRH